MKTEYLKKNFFNWAMSLTAAAIPLEAECAPAGELSYRASGVATVELRHAAAQDRRETTVPGCVICAIGSGETLVLSFDIIGGGSESLYYSFAHFNADWQPSDLMEMEFVDGLNKVYGAESTSLSFNTTTAFTHYEMTIDTSPLRASGNYMVEARRADDDALLVREPIWMSEEACGIMSRVDREESEQAVEMSVRWPRHGLSSPETQMMVYAWQNKRTDDMRLASGPTFVRPDEIVYQGISEFRFCGGREWRWLDTRSVRLPGLSDSQVEYIPHLYHFTLATDYPARGYTFREDFNGGGWTETRDRRDGEADEVADYVMAHFTFAPEDPTLLDKDEVYVIGDATGWSPSAANRLQPDAADITFKGQHLVKQGLDNYLYVAREKRRGHGAPQMTDTEGCYGETENDYYIAVYVRRPGDTYDRLVAVKRHNTLKTRNAFIM